MFYAIVVFQIFLSYIFFSSVFLPSFVSFHLCVLPAVLMIISFPSSLLFVSFVLLLSVFLFFHSQFLGSFFPFPFFLPSFLPSFPVFMILWFLSSSLHLLLFSSSSSCILLLLFFTSSSSSSSSSLLLASFSFTSVSLCFWSFLSSFLPYILPIYFFPTHFLPCVFPSFRPHFVEFPSSPPSTVTMNKCFSSSP